MRITAETIPGPPVSNVGREQADRGLAELAKRRKASTYTLEPVNGQWVGTLVFEATEKQADSPFGGPAEDDEEAAGPKSEGPDDTSDGSDSGADSAPDSDSGDSPAGPPKDDDKGDSKGKGGEDHLLHQVLDALSQIGDALGVPLNLGGSPVPGLDGPDGPPGGPAGPPAPGGPAGGPPGAPPSSHGDKFPKPMHPGDAPPGVPPIGTPAFSSVSDGNPFAHMAGKVASFKASRPIGDTPIHEVTKEVTRLAQEVGYNAYVQEARDDEGNRIANCFITVHQQ